MKWCFPLAGYDLWSSIVNGYVPTKNVKSTTQKEARIYNSKAKKIILDRLFDHVKGRVGKCVLAKEIWDKLKDLYSAEGQETESSMIKYLMNSINHEDKGSPKHYVCNKSKCDDFSHMSEKVDEGILDCEVELVAALEEIDDLINMIKK